MNVVWWTQNILQKSSLRVCFISRGTNKQSIGPANSVDEFHNIIFFSKFFRYIISITLDAVFSCIQNHGCIIWEQRNLTIFNVITFEVVLYIMVSYSLKLCHMCVICNIVLITCAQKIKHFSCIGGLSTWKIILDLLDVVVAWEDRRCWRCNNHLIS